MDSRTFPLKVHFRQLWLILGLLGLGQSTAIALLFTSPAIALPPAEDTPEEILRTEIILEARSPIDGEALTASEYVELQEDIGEADNPPSLSSEAQQVIFLLQIRKFLNIVSPVQIL